LEKKSGGRNLFEVVKRFPETMLYGDSLIVLFMHKTYQKNEEM
jgi:hypothetical protein